jgi:hypothetical protein
VKANLSKQRKERKFDKILQDSIDQSLSALGENTKNTVYLYLETKFAIPKKDIPDRIADFSDALEQIFGVASANLEILIMVCLNKKVKCEYEWVGPKWLVPDLTFKKYVKLLEIWCEENEKGCDVKVIVNAEERPEQRTQ